MNEISLPSGVQEYRINGRAILRFNPSDPAMYKRFMKLIEGIEAIGKEMTQVSASGSDPAAMIFALDDFDRRIKEHLAEAFGRDNDFDAIFDGCSVFATADTGEWIVTEFLNAIRPVIEAEMKRSLDKKVAAAHLNREQRRAAQRR